ncbi:enoyl-CoA hydratase/isomerase family protein, partial [Luminiphilus sp.]|nr:enoyl-CoA hydratase/isomerase family protein [Luminiphilus sp.]
MNSSNPEETVHLNVAGAIATITLDRPHLRNALDRKTMKSFMQVASDVSDRDDVRAVVIAAEGADFSVGADLKEVQGMESDGSLLRARRDAELGRKMLNSIREIHQPTVCALQGIATGGGAC